MSSSSSSRGPGDQSGRYSYQPSYGHPPQYQEAPYYPPPVQSAYDPRDPRGGGYGSGPAYAPPAPSWSGNQPGYDPNQMYAAQTSYSANDGYNGQSSYNQTALYSDSQPMMMQNQPSTYVQNQGESLSQASRPSSAQESDLAIRSDGSSVSTLDANAMNNSSSSQLTTTSQNATSVKDVVPGNAYPSQSQLKAAYAYGIRRSDGMYTRLYRADELMGMDLNTIASNQGPQGLIILPQPELNDPSTHAGPEQMIDNLIIADFPQNRPSQAVRGGYYGGRGGYNGGHGSHGSHGSRGNYPQIVDATQQHIDAIVASSPSAFPRREKVYCDMWVHKGTCAFTQMGCKYKHMMPMDRETQVYMGLSDGIPSWFRHKYGLNMSGQPIRPPLTGGAPPLSALPPASNYSMLPPPHSSLPAAPPHSNYGNRGGLAGGSWRRPAGALAAEPFNSPSTSGNPGARRGGRNTYGAVGQRSTMSNNPFGPLDSLKNEDDDEEDVITDEFRNRQNRAGSETFTKKEGKGFSMANHQNGNGTSNGNGAGGASGN